MNDRLQLLTSRLILWDVEDADRAHEKFGNISESYCIPPEV
jgi:hypothetical protein